MAFRGSAKSSLAEEDIVIAALYRVFKNILIIGASEGRAAERLASVGYELSMNENILELFGVQKGSTWSQTKLVTTGGVCIQAMGRDQDIRGIKYLDHRPDFILVDDFEDKDSVQTPDGRAKTLRWFLAELMPACAPDVKIRIRATPMDVESVPMRLGESGSWPTKTYPIEYLDGAGRRVPSWGGSPFTLGWIDQQRATYEAVGELSVWNREYMCNAVSDSDRVFKSEMIRVLPRVRVWEAVYGMIDPARTVGVNSALTGWAIWSWVRNRLVVWAADGAFLLPDEIVALGFDLSERFDLVHLGVEVDGVHQWLLQPFRQEMVRRGVMIPLRGTGAMKGTQGRGQTDFIKGLQPFFHNREVEFAQPLPALTAQLLNFPTGRRDIPNALAYAMLLRPAAPIYDGFTSEHIVETVSMMPGSGLHLAANATGSVTTAVLVQHGGGVLRVLADWVLEGPPAERVAEIAAAAVLAADGARYRQVSVGRSWEDQLREAAPDRLLLRAAAPVWTVPAHHSDRYRNVGLMQAVRRVPAEIRAGGAENTGSLYIRDALGRSVRGFPAVEVSSSAKWTLRALAGGYTRAMVRGRLQDAAEEGPYRVLMEGLEAFCGLVSTRPEENADDDSDQRYRVDERTGVRYASAMPQARVR